MHIENYYATLHLIPTALVGKCYLILYCLAFKLSTPNELMQNGTVSD